MSTETKAVKSGPRELTFKEKLYKYRVEVSVLFVVFFFISGITFAALFSEKSVMGEVKNLYWQVSGKNNLSTGNIVRDCTKEANKNKRYCVERESRIKSNWNSIRQGGRASAQFSLHGK